MCFFTINLAVITAILISKETNAIVYIRTKYCCFLKSVNRVLKATAGYNDCDPRSVQVKGTPIWPGLAVIEGSYTNLQAEIYGSWCRYNMNTVYVMSCHVIVRNRLSLSMGLRSVAAGASPSFISGRGQGTPWTSRQLIAGPSLMSNVGYWICMEYNLY